MQQKILIVEDDEINQILISSFLEEHDLGFSIASDGKYAVELVGGSHFDLILMDLNMPVMDGFEAAKEIRKSIKELPIVALTASDDEEDIQKCREAGMNDYIIKPVDLDRLQNIINKWLGNKIESDIRKTFEKNNEIFNYEEVLQKFYNEKDVVKEVLQVFLSNIFDQKDKLQEAIDKEDYDGIKSLAHFIKGAALNICAYRIGEVATELDKKTKERAEISIIKQLYADLRDEFDAFKAHIEQSKFLLEE